MILLPTTLSTGRKEKRVGTCFLLTVALLLTFCWQEVVPGFYLDLGEIGKCTCGEMETH